MTAILRLDHVGKSFPALNGGGAVHALADVSFSVDSGEYICLLGRSGCGKSTLLGIVAGLIRPDSGRILCADRPVDGPDRHRMLMFQDAALFPWKDVLGNVLYGLKYVPGLSRQERLRRARDFLALVGLSRFEHFRIHELSGGMRQRAALARALAPDPDILLMDEPFSALDAMTRDQLYADMQRIWQETGKTIIMVTHNVREAVCVGSRVILLEAEGRIVANERVDLLYPRDLNDTALAATAARLSNFFPHTAKG
jgi:NitT/TauT family transport system ATP-binding protein